MNWKESMAFLPQNSKERKKLFIIVMVLAYIGVEIYFGAEYAMKRDSNFRAFRWDTKTLWRLKSSYTGTAFGEDIHTNTDGFRGEREYPTMSDHTLRIVTIGDSRSYGFGVEDDETFSAVLEKGLRDRGHDAEVINAGTHGYSAVQCRGRLEQVLDYKPDIAVLAPGYNDRRYIASRPADSSESFKSIARVRKVLDVLSWSNLFFGMLCEVGEYKLRELKENPSGLDVIPVRVSERQFEKELINMLAICREEEIVPVFLLIYQDSNAYDIVERAQLLYDLNDSPAAIELIEEAFNTVPNRAYSMSRYLLGLCYERLGDMDKARENFANHQPSGSIFGEAVLRSERRYYDIIRRLAEEHSVLLVDGREAIVKGIESPVEAEEAFRKEFVDECHYTAEGHQRMGMALTEAVAGRLTLSADLEPTLSP